MLEIAAKSEWLEEAFARSDSTPMDKDERQEESLNRTRIRNEHADQSRHAVAVAIALAQQAAEFLIKSKICEVSPFLLLAPEQGTKWTGRDQSFADMKTVDAQDLVRLHKTVCPTPLPEEFRNTFERFRRSRNTIVHGVDNRERFSVKDGILVILQYANALLGEKAWAKTRQAYYDDQYGIGWEYYGHHTDTGLVEETATVLFEVLQPAEVRRYYHFDRDQRCYSCPHCADKCRDVGLPYALAQLRPNTPDSTQLFCVCCSQTTTTIREDCGRTDCRGNVIDAGSGQCLTCR